MFVCVCGGGGRLGGWVCVGWAACEHEIHAQVGRQACKLASMQSCGRWDRRTGFIFQVELTGCVPSLRNVALTTDSTPFASLIVVSAPYVASSKQASTHARKQARAS